jgi:hypothetical protein
MTAKDAIILILICALLILLLDARQNIKSLQEHVHFLHVELGILIDAPKPEPIP